MRKERVHVITMGCAKNTVDSEKLMAHLGLAGVELTESIDDADIAVINTCGFIEAAKRESIDMIIAQVKRKAKGKLRKVYAMGCLTERYREALADEIPEVDGFFGTHETPAILKALGAELKHELLGERKLTTPSHTAYLKISEGCDNPCSFCAIPLMRGRHGSRPADEIIAEARLLASRGVRELVVIGQDTTSYGIDTEGKRTIAGLLQRLGDIDGIAWVRLMYAYPAKFPLDLLDVIGHHPSVCAYLDLPVQHSAEAVLRSMRRGITRRATVDLIKRIRDRIPGVTLRTTLIVGYPAEGEREFDDLQGFVREIAFDRLGVFTYSQEEGTEAYRLGDPVPAKEKERRQSVIMEAQQKIALARNEALIGSRQRVLIDRQEGDTSIGQPAVGRTAIGRTAIGRTVRDAPDIDNEVLIEGTIPPGSFVDVEIVDASEYDLYGKEIGT